MTRGRVYIVGAGPGDPKLLTLRAIEVLKSAELVVYDRLVTSAIIKLIPAGARKICAGKTAQRRQNKEQINRILVSEARKGKKVVRLKGGDPFIFARGGDEAAALKAHGVEFEVIPGISSAFAAPAYAGIPLTHRKYSSSVALVTGHEDPRKEEPRVKWSQLASAVDTIVVLMGAAKLKEISRELIQGGLCPDTPVAAIEWATTRKQKTVLFTLREAPKVSSRLNAPSVIVVGKVAALAKELSWFFKKPT